MINTTPNIADIAMAGILYKCAATCKVQHRAVSCDPLHSLCIAISRFRRELNFSDQWDDYWAPFVGYLLDYIYAVLSIPLPFNRLCDPSAYTRLSKQLDHCDSLYPSFTDPARKLLELYRQVADSNDNPLGEAVLQIIAEIPHGDKFALLVERARYARSIEEYYSKVHAVRNLEVVTPAKLREPCFYEHIILTGIPKRFPSYVFSAPRCANLYVVRYHWIRRGARVRSSFVHLLPRKQASSGYASAPGSAEGMGDDVDAGLPGDEQEPIEDDSDLEEDDALWSGTSYQVLRAADIFKNIRTIARRFDSSLNNESARHTGTLKRRAAQDAVSDSQETVSARLFLLEDGYGVFFDADEDSRVLAVDIESDVEPKVERIPTSEVEPGMFVLLRIGGGGDYIADLANEILGTDASTLRGKQRMWKQRLRALVDEQGIDQVTASLRRLGCSKANEQNVRNWISFRSIRTQSERDFAAIMKLVGLGSQHSVIWSDMNRIASAHRKAGHRIRKLLLAKVRSANLRDLRRSGRMDFQLEGGMGGSMAILRVENISPGTVELPPSRLGRSFLIGKILRFGDLRAVREPGEPATDSGSSTVQ